MVIKITVREYDPISKKKFLENFGELTIFVGMKDLVYRFLDEYLGDEVVCEPNGMKEWYIICSKKNNQRILKFFVHTKRGVQQIRLFRDWSLCSKVQGYCGIDTEEDCANYIRDWFGDKHGLNKVSDVLKFFPQR